MNTCYANGMQTRVLSIAKRVDGTELARRILFLSRVGNETKSKLDLGALFLAHDSLPAKVAMIHKSVFQSR